MMSEVSGSITHTAGIKHTLITAVSSGLSPRKTDERNLHVTCRDSDVTLSEVTSI